MNISRSLRRAALGTVLLLGACHGEAAFEPWSLADPAAAALPEPIATDQPATADPAPTARAPAPRTELAPALPPVATGDDADDTAAVAPPVHRADLAGRPERTFSRVERRRARHRAQPLPPAAWPR